MDSYSLRVGIGGVASVFPRVRLLSSLDKKVARCDVPFLRNDADATSWRVIINLLKGQKLIIVIFNRYNPKNQPQAGN